MKLGGNSDSKPIKMQNANRLSNQKQLKNSSTVIMNF